RGRVSADVARHLSHLLMRDVEPVVAAEREQEVVASDARDLLRLEAQQLPDAVVLVDDEVARAQVRERLQRARAQSTLARRASAEDLRVRQQDETEIAPDEAATRRRDREEELRLAWKPIAVVDDARADASQEVLLPHRLAAMRERDDDTVSGAHER